MFHIIKNPNKQQQQQQQQQQQLILETERLRRRKEFYIYVPYYPCSMVGSYEFKFMYIHKEFMIKLKKYKLNKIKNMLNNIIIPNMTDIIIKYIYLDENILHEKYYTPIIGKIQYQS